MFGSVQVQFSHQFSTNIHYDVHHENYNPSCKAKTNMQEDSDGPMTRARAKQLKLRWS
jgi:hypothetical protein